MPAVECDPPRWLLPELPRLDIVYTYRPESVPSDLEQMKKNRELTPWPF
jgi:hypothetical protein